MDGPSTSRISRAASPTLSDGVDYRYRGVGGWLLFFIFTLVFIGPATRVYGFLEAYGHIMRVFARSSHSTAALVYYFAEQMASFAVYGYGVFAGIELWKMRPGAVEKAKLFILVLLAFALLDYASGLIWIVLATPEANRASALFRVADGTGVEIIFKTCIYGSIWYAYLMKSKRVRATFSPKNRHDNASIPYAGLD